jgi:monoamine oxidase
MKTDVLIAGGGLAGLSLAYRLEQEAIDYRVVEARSRLGGRVLSLPSTKRGAREDRYDLGPAWFWPGQPRLQELLDELGLSAFPQYSHGNLVYQDQDGTVQRDLQYSTMAGSLRVSGGIACLAESLSRRIPAHKILVNQKVTGLCLSDDGIYTTIQQNGEEAEIRSSLVALALPPRLAAQSIAFQPALESNATGAMGSIPTWMATHAKVIATYEKPFWREAGLSGDGISQRGPLVEIHDASPATGTTGALFGFVGVPAAARRSPEFDIAKLAVEQLGLMYGAKGAQPMDVLVQDWAREEYTATADDENEQLLQHPPYGTPASLANLWDGKLLLTSSEMAPVFGGYLEGALEAAETTATRIIRTLTP